MVSFSEMPLGANLAIFAGAAAVVWAAGSRMGKQADEVAERTGLSKAFLGILLLGVATSLPEIATTVTGSLLGNARLVAGNLFGGVAMQVAVLAIADLVAVRGALSYFAPQPILLFQGVMLLTLLGAAMAGTAAGEPVSLLGMGVTPVLLLAGYVFTLYMSRTGKLHLPWEAKNPPESLGQKPKNKKSHLEEISNLNLSVRVGLAAAAILLAGWVLASVGDVLSEQTGLGASFVGVALVAVSTSLPEVSTTISAVRQGNHQMAVSNILGTNCLEVALFVVADACYRGGPILAEVDRSALFAAALGMIVTGIYLVGLLERQNRTILRMGVDSFAVLVTYLAGLGVLYYLR